MVEGTEGRLPLIRCDGIDSRAWLWYVEGLTGTGDTYVYFLRSVPSFKPSELQGMNKATW